MSNDLSNEIKIIVTQALDNAELIWSKSEKLLIKSAYDSISEGFESMPVASNIPGHPFLFRGASDVSEFIAFVVDMRESTKHLKTHIADAKVTQLQRVYYETSALLPALAKTVEYEGGKVTEYLGDGLLALFKVDESDKTKALYAARRAAINCLSITRPIVNSELSARYRLPEIDIGIGLSISPAIVLLVGLEDYQHPKVIGSCVYTATKLACERNKIFTDEFIEHMWPSSKGGQVRFVKHQVKTGETGYQLTSV